MALINCPECNKEVSDKATKCPNCGYDFKAEKEKKEKKKEDTVKGCGCLSVFVIIIIGLVYFSISGDETAAPPTETHPDKFLAYSYAEDFVKKKLKSPGTAKFPGTFEKETHIFAVTDNKYQIRSWVDSQNGFGALIRTNFYCVIRFKADSVFCEDLQIFE